MVQEPEGVRASSATKAGRHPPRVDRTLGVIDDQALELAFRREGLPGEVRQATAVILVAIALLAAFGINDLRVARGTPDFQTLALLRAAAIGLSLVTLAAIRNGREPTRIDRWMSGFLVGLGAAIVALSAVRPAASPIPHLINGLALMAFLGAYPGPTRRALPGSLVLGVGSLAVLAVKGPPPDPLALVAIPSVLVGGAVMGWSVSRGVQFARRELFLAVEKQRAANKQLQAAQAELRSLRGIIPICGHCKKIRTDTGYWQELEQYLSDRSDASFSHGICPDCARTYWPDEVRELEGGPRR